MKQRKLFWVMLPIVLTVWGIIVYQFYQATSLESGTEMISGVNSLSHASQKENTESFIYKKDIRDPFQFLRPRRDTLKTLATALAVPWTPPPFRLTGIIEAKKKKTVTLEGENGSTFFLEEGDTVGGIRIIKVTNTSVTYFYNKKKNSWVLEN